MVVPGSTFGGPWLVLAPLWLPFGFIWLPLGSILDLSAPSGLYFLSKIIPSGTPFREAPADYRMHRQHRKIVARILTSLGPERAYCRRQLRSAPGRRPPGVFESETACALSCTAPYLAGYLFGLFSFLGLDPILDSILLGSQGSILEGPEICFKNHIFSHHFSHRFLEVIVSVFSRFWLPFGVHFACFFMFFASLFRAWILSRFFINLGMDFNRIFMLFGDVLVFFFGRLILSIYAPRLHGSTIFEVLPP